MSPATRALRRLAREFLYRPLPDLFGKTATVESSDSVDGSVRSLLLAQGLEPGPRKCEGALVTQYDLIDALMKVFLRSTPLRDRRDPSVLRQMVRGELPAGYFPRRFVVEDACVTNVPTAWLLKHFYL